jgi:hypothetical protein
MNKNLLSKWPLFHICLLLLWVTSMVQGQSITIQPGSAGNIQLPNLSYAQIMAISAPKEGMMAYDTTYHCLRYYNGYKWVCSDQNPNQPPAPQTTAWGQGGSYGFGVQTDANGNIYVVGMFYLTPDFGNGITKVSSGNTDGYLLKYSPNGTLQWVAQIGGTGFDRVQSVAIDAAGQVYITGVFENTATFYHANGNSFTTRTSNGNKDLYVARYNSNGVAQWVCQMGGIGQDQGWDITIAGTKIFIGGMFSNTATIYNSANGIITSMTSNGETDAFLAAYTTSGVFDWARQIGGLQDDIGYGVAATATHAYLVGQFFGTAQFFTTAELSAGTETSAGGHDIFTTKYDHGGNLIWRQRIGGLNEDVAFSVAVNTDDEVFLTGTFRSSFSVPFGSLASKGEKDVFALKYSSAGVLQNSVSVGGLSDDYGYKIAIGSTGAVYVMGTFFNSAIVANNVFALGGVNQNHTFLVKFSQNLVAQWAQVFGVNNSAVGNGMCHSSQGIFTVGNHNPMAVFGTTTLNEHGVFVAKTVE